MTLAAVAALYEEARRLGEEALALLSPGGAAPLADGAGAVASGSPDGPVAGEGRATPPAKAQAAPGAKAAAPSAEGRAASPETAQAPHPAAVGLDVDRLLALVTARERVLAQAGALLQQLPSGSGAAAALRPAAQALLDQTRELQVRVAAALAALAVRARQVHDGRRHLAALRQALGGLEGGGLDQRG